MHSPIYLCNYPLNWLNCIQINQFISQSSIHRNSSTTLFSSFLNAQKRLCELPSPSNQTRWYPQKSRIILMREEIVRGWRRPINISYNYMSTSINVTLNNTTNSHKCALIIAIYLWHLAYTFESSHKKHPLAVLIENKWSMNERINSVSYKYISINYKQSNSKTDKYLIRIYSIHWVRNQSIFFPRIKHLSIKAILDWG